jgi:RsiW-degrading membrane proteinase PrsW (M82 family)/ribosomal protein S18 acetylase RimI-like enzyme
MQLLALAIAPGLAICLFIFHRDAYNREPKRNLLFSFFLGACSIITAIIIEGLLKNLPAKTISGTAVSAFLVVALTEELGKFIVLRYYAYTRKSFDEPLDGIVYGVMISMGFATLENVLYVVKYAELGQGYQIALLRMFTAVPAHATFGVLMGYYVGKAKFDAVNRNRLLLTGLFWAVLFHGAYDYCLFLQGVPAIKDYISDGVLFTGALISFIIAIRLSLRHIKMHRRLSQQTFRPTETMALRKAYPHDIPLIRDLAFKIWPVTYESILTKDQLDYMLGLLYSEAKLAEDMQKGSEFVMLYDGVQPIGFAAIGLTEPQVYKLHKIYVLPGYQGKGAGKFIINELITAIKRKGATTLLLNVNRHNPAKGFYEKLGFTVIKEEDVDIGNGYFMNDYVMEKKV